VEFVSMKTLAVWGGLFVIVGLEFVGSRGAWAAATADHKKQITEITKEAAKASSLISKKDYDEAAKVLDEAEKKLKQIAKEADLKEGDKLIAGPLKKIATTREQLGRKRPASGAGGGSVSFEKDVAPILVARCLNCHGNNNPKANLQIDTFAGIKNGGDSGPVFVVPGRPNESLLLQRLTATDDSRMPKGPNPLPADDIKKISEWVAAGAKFTGNNNTPLSQLKAAAEVAAKADAVPIQINKPTGNETVSFTKDIAPFMVNLCVNCHSGNDPRSGFSLETFEKLMKGGKSGRVVLPGNTKDSRLWHLVGEQDPIKMPPAQALITTTNHSNLRKWIEEGAKFDGADPKATLRSLVPTEAEKRAKELASLSNEDLAKRLRERADQLWKSALANDPATVEETNAFVVMGNAGEGRNKQVAEWAGSATDRLRKLFNIKESLIWRGKLTIFVFKDRFSYAEFAQTNENVEIPADTKGHARVSSAGDEAYVCVLDVGDAVTETSPGLKTLLTGLMVEGLLQRLPNRVPDWASKGTGLMLAAQADPKNPYFRGLNAAAHESLHAVDKPEELFANGTFSPADLPAIGFTLVNFMMKKGGEPYFVNFLSQLAQGKSLADSLRDVYNVDAATLAQSYFANVESLPGSKAGAKKKK
jgi:hypothetical protein